MILQLWHSRCFYIASYWFIHLQKLDFVSGLSTYISWRWPHSTRFFSYQLSTFTLDTDRVEYHPDFSIKESTQLRFSIKANFAVAIWQILLNSLIKLQTPKNFNMSRLVSFYKNIYIENFWKVSCSNQKTEIWHLKTLFLYFQFALLVLAAVVAAASAQYIYNGLGYGYGQTYGYAAVQPSLGYGYASYGYPAYGYGYQYLKK